MADPIVGVPAPNVIPSAIAVAAFHADKGTVRESSGKNRSPVIDAMCKLFGAALGSPYCALGVSTCFLTFWRRNKPAGGKQFPYTASSQYIKRVLGSEGLLSRDANDLLNWEGAVGGWTDADGAHGHVFLIERRLTNGAGKVVGIGTLEYNTNALGDRDGEGEFRMVRKLASNGLWYATDDSGKLVGTGRKLWFCDVSSFAGGQWWAK